MRTRSGNLILAAVAALAMFADARTSRGQSSAMSGSGGGGMTGPSSGAGAAGGGASSPDACPGSGPGAPGAGVPPHDEAALLSPRRNLRFSVSALGIELVYDSGSASAATPHGGAGWRLGRPTLTTLGDGSVVLDEAGAESVFTPNGEEFDAPTFETRRLELVSPGVYDLHLGGGAVARFENGRESTIRDPHGTRVTFGYDGSGRLTSIVDVATGIATALTYAAGRLVSVSRDGMTQALSYDEGDRLQSVTAPWSGSGDGATQQAFGYDAGSDRMTDITNEAGETTHVAYAVDGGLASVSLPDSLTYELRCETDPDDGLLVLRVVDSFGQSFAQKHASDGSVASTTDQFGRVTTYTRDGEGRIVAVASEDLSVATSYNATDDVVSVTGADGETSTYTYDGDHNLLTETDPLGRTTSYAHDGFGNVISTTDVYGRVSYFDRNSHGDVWRVRTPDGLAVSYTLDGWGRATSVQEPDGTVTSWTLDARGAVTSVSLPDGTSMSVTRTPHGLPVTVTDRLGRVTTMTWDDARRLTRVDLPGPSEPYLDLQRDSAGRITQSVAALGPVSQVVSKTYGLYGETATMSLNGIASQVAPRMHALLPPPGSPMTGQANAPAPESP
jgi:YD repeat-containing protein